MQGLGVQAVELGCGGTAGHSHANPEILLNDAGALREFQRTIDRHHMEISALSCHGNPVHPNPETARAYDKTIRDTILLAQRLGLRRINTFSGCPGSDPDAHYPNWVTCPWPEDFQEVLDYQWNQVLIPYWRETAAFAAEHGVTQIALEMHPGFCVYHTESLLRLRRAVELARLQYTNGYTDYLTVLDAERQLFSSELTYASALRDRADAVVSVCMALGGGWEDPGVTPSFPVIDTDRLVESQSKGSVGVRAEKLARKAAGE